MWGYSRAPGRPGARVGVALALDTSCPLCPPLAAWGEREREPSWAGAPSCRGEEPKDQCGKRRLGAATLPSQAFWAPHRRLG